ncbi:sulfotransferase family protein [Methylobrevis pamukkalensis]|uniref:Sulfotransferase family protein n=1 Tax=Methylobrevis pamukkalensis TaxID=1439726 RepID=A0A1E3H883_9HYPH|nr:sulfotransferase family protein [Methylobrevis pamukkalensis]ODN72355.1 Sulfotransferase family protein [Methylobrevis pamukkalensis]
MFDEIGTLGARVLTYLRHPHRMRSVIVLKPWRLAYVRVPKAANSSIKQALHHLMTAGEVTDPAFAAYPSVPNINRDRFWRREFGARAEMTTCGRFLRVYPGFTSFTVVRNPFARVVSAYYDKIIARDELPGAMRRTGYSKTMSFRAFVERTAVVGDDLIDIHLCSQSRILSEKGRLVPDLVGRVETLDADWTAIRTAIAARGGPRLGALANTLVKTSGLRPPVAALYAADPGLADLVLARYRADFELFYPDRAMPAD